MTLEDLQKLPTLQTKSISFASEDPNTGLYLLSCLERFYKGDYGLVPQEDTEANNADLEAGDGHILARYEQREKLTGQIYIEAMIFEPKLSDIDYNYIMIMYTDER